ncbi:MAG: hypothetical protein ACOX1Y_01270 [Zhaonellaceae bacterium]|jgi:hypothetical protein|nr:hypothetical protein [Clostridia bacterium]
MPTKSLLNTSGSYEVITNKTENSIELTLILDKSWAKQLGLPNNKFVINEPNTNDDQHERQLEEKLWATISETAQPVKITDYYYPEEAFKNN